MPYVVWVFVGLRLLPFRQAKEPVAVASRDGEVGSDPVAVGRSAQPGRSPTAYGWVSEMVVEPGALAGPVILAGMPGSGAMDSDAAIREMKD